MMKSVILGVMLLVVLSKQDNIDSSSALSRVRHCLRQNEIIGCFKRQVARNLREAVDSDAIWPITDYLSINKNPDWKQNVTQPLDEMNPDEAITRGMQDLVQSRSLQVKFYPDVDEAEGRKKKDKNGGVMMMAGLAMAGMLGQMFMGKIAFLAGTALMISKLALLLSSLIGLKKLVGSGGGGGSDHVVYASADHGHGGWQRSYGSNQYSDQDAHVAAYSAQAPVYSVQEEQAPAPVHDLTGA